MLVIHAAIPISGTRVNRTAPNPRVSTESTPIRIEASRIAPSVMPSRISAPGTVA